MVYDYVMNRRKYNGHDLSKGYGHQMFDQRMLSVPRISIGRTLCLGKLRNALERSCRKISRAAGCKRKRVWCTSVRESMNQRLCLTPCT